MTDAASTGEDVISINVKTLDESSFTVKLSNDSLTVTALKAAIVCSTGGSIPAARQRLIYRGKVLADGSPLSAYDIADGVTVHLVARAADETVASPDYHALLAGGMRNTAIPSPLLGGIGASADGFQVRSSMWSSIAALSSDAGIHPISQLALGSSLSATGEAGPRESTSASVSNHDWASQSASMRAIQTINQTLHTLASVIAATGATGNEESESVSLNEVEEVPRLTSATPGDRDSTAVTLTSEDHQPVCRRVLSVGQFVDVLDTVDQWLEAVVVRVRRSHVYVHYSGWPERWDEWLRVDSERLAPFRTRSAHTTLGFALCPQPVNVLPTDYVPSLPAFHGITTAPSGSSSRNAYQRTVNCDSKSDSTGGKRVEVTLRADDVRAILPGMANAARTLTRVLDSLVALSEQQITNYAHEKAFPLDGESDSSSVESLADLSFATARQQVAPVVAAAPSQEGARSSSQLTAPVDLESQLSDITSIAVPILDKFGRALSDLAPLVHRLTSAPRFAGQCATMTRAYDTKFDEEIADTPELPGCTLKPSPILLAEASRAGYLSIIKPPQVSPWPDDADPRLRSTPGFGLALAGDRSASLMNLASSARRRNRPAHRIGGGGVLTSVFGAPEFRPAGIMLELNLAPAAEMPRRRSVSGEAQGEGGALAGEMGEERRGEEPRAETEDQDGSRTE